MSNSNQTAAGWLADFAAGQSGAFIGSSAGQLGAASKPASPAPPSKGK